MTRYNMYLFDDYIIFYLLHWEINLFVYLKLF